MTDSAIWLTCRECGTTTRVLALMASRVLASRTHCAECQSTCEPCVNRTPAGTNISLSEEQGSALREMDDPAVRAWLLGEQRRSAAESSPLNWMRAVPGLLAGRFSRAGQVQRAGRAAGRHGTDTWAGSAAILHEAGTIAKTGSAIRP